ncbi:MAG: penicillin acylase family protein [Phaeospirillum sp.]|nr:penicillin acylase family protein [Phaeospirillum sp.]
MSNGNAAAEQPDPPLIGHEMGRATKIINTVLLIVLLTVSVAWVVLMSNLPRVDGTIVLSGIRQGASISRDSLGVPRITARSPTDAYFALGWTHAQDRMWQMELQRRAGAGRLAEIVGEPGLANDRFMRTLGIYGLAERAFPKLDEASRSALTAYAEGVNAWIANNRYRLPLEYIALGFRPEPWKAADSMVWQKMMALQLAGNWHDDVLRGQLGRSLDPKRVQELFPGYPQDAPVTLSPDGGRALLDAQPTAASPMPASNIWVVGGSRTDTGKPMLANDPHLALRAPVLWYLAEIEAPGLTLSGATVPGVPFHIVAHNRRIAWGITATQADTIDLFVEKLVGTDAYKAPGGAKPFLNRDEVIRVKDAADVTMTVRESRHGPILSDLIAKDVAGPGEVVAFASSLLTEGDLGMQALHRLNLAADWTGFVAAVKDLQAPVLNLGYADSSGNIGFYTAGLVPIRKAGNGMTPARGWTGEGDWTGWVPFAKMPQSYNPRSGVLVNANNKVTPDKYPHLITATWSDGYRAQRIRDLLEAKKPLTLADMSAIQGDALSLQAVELKDLLTGLDFKSKPSRDAAHLVAEWNGRADHTRPEPLIFAAWFNRLNRVILADELKERFDSLGSPRAQTLVEILTRRRHWCDDISTPEPESCEDQIERSLDLAVKDLSETWGPDMGKWTWGAAHQAGFDSAILGKVPVLKHFANLEIPSDGDEFTIARGTYRPDAKATSFTQTHGPGLRAVFDLGNLANSRFVIATGQSGHPLSRHYSDMIEAWRDNRLIWPTQGTARTALILEHGR